MSEDASERLHVFIFALFLLVVVVIFIAPSFTGLITNDIGQSPTDISAATVFSLWLLPLGLMATAISIYALWAIKGSAHRG